MSEIWMARDDHLAEVKYARLPFSFCLIDHVYSICNDELATCGVLQCMQSQEVYTNTMHAVEKK